LTQDDEYLRLLSLFHYVVAGITAIFACFPIIHFGFGVAMILAPDAFAHGGEPPPVFFGWLFAILAAAFMTIGWTFAALIFSAGRLLARRKNYMFCLVIAALETMWAPFGTVLGVFTIIVLMRDSVKQIFAANRSSAASVNPIGGPLA
jgi:hypothetical protein